MGQTALSNLGFNPNSVRSTWIAGEMVSQGVRAPERMIGMHPSLWAGCSIFDFHAPPDSENTSLQMKETTSRNVQDV